MSKEELKKYIPDTEQEWAFIGASINRLGCLMSGIGAFQEDYTWVITSVALTWIGHEVSEYLKIHMKDAS